MKNKQTKLHQGLGLIHYYYGNGAGKTSIGLGHITRAIGHDLKPILIQFLKKHDPEAKEGYFYGEYKTLTEKLDIPVIQYGTKKFIFSQKDITAEIRALGEIAIQELKNILMSDAYHVVILDELVTFITLGIVKLQDILDLLKNKRNDIEVIITGREYIPELEQITDYATRLEERKHPYQQGIMAREGIEY